MKKILLYAHGGSENHGCEAIVRTTCKMLTGNLDRITLFSFDVHQDEKYLQGSIRTKQYYRRIRRYSIPFWVDAFCVKLLKNRKFGFHYKNKIFIDSIERGAVCVSIGGDNYCYGNYHQELAYQNALMARRGAKSVLWGCSIEPELLRQPDTVEDLKRYALITARESITYQALLQAGVKENVRFYPDPAFTLDAVQMALPAGFAKNNTVGINLSPLIIGCETNEGATMENYAALIQHIIDKTDMQIALIPHVVWAGSDDRAPMRTLYGQFQGTGRVVMVDDHNCEEQKGFIARCRMFIGARTHATIAAYSSCVPTLVIGYSVKAKGIARDIFGSYENYVLPVQSLRQTDDLIRAFSWMMQNEEPIRRHLQECMPAYIEKARLAAGDINALME